MADDDDTGGDTGSTTRRRGIQSIEIGMRILEALGAAGGASPLSAIAQAVGMPAPQVHRYLQSLITSGMARQDAASGRYDLGSAALRLGLVALARTDAFKIVDRVIDGFVERTGQTVQISAFGPMGPTIVRLYNGRPALLTTLHVGSVLPLLASATGRVFLAFMPRSETASLVNAEQDQAGSASLTIEMLCAAVKADGMAIETGTVIPGLHATAFPILDLQGRATLVATALVSQAAEADRKDAVAELGELCRHISKEMGWLNAQPRTS
ncbi:IclR family transcriptional regulator [Sphingomonas sp. 4RDLI-65]|uniref:IclR family transcriptional regulator n=1 Tax=Sphingomonas sp. 4RDLI-65 TaxID=3111641 RepID=UPI003C1C56E0